MRVPPRSRGTRTHVVASSGARPRRLLRAHGRERGQVLVEFAIAAPVLLLLGLGILQFGFAVNYWLDLHRLANEGARWAAVNEYPGCNATPAAPCSPTLQTYLGQQPRAGASVAICLEEENGSPGSTRGDAVTVRLTSPFTFLPIVNVGTISLSAAATMRIEEAPSRYAAGAC
jgi:hypothetical protein